MKKNENDEIVVDINLLSEKDFFSKYSKKTISPNLKEYIINELVGYDTNEKVVLQISSNKKLSEKEKENYELILKREFRETIIEIKFIAKKEILSILGLLIIGIIFIILSYLLNNLGIINEVLKILGWFAIGQVAYNVAFTNSDRKRKIKRLMQILLAKVEFI